MPYTRPEYPQILKKTDWDNKKGAFAKIAGKTGVGEAAAECERRYAAVQWQKLELAKTAPGVNSFTKADWDRRLADAKTEVTGNLRQLVEALYKLRDVAKAAEAKFKSNKLIPSSSTAHVAQLAQAADFLGVSLNANSIGTPIMADYNDVLARMKQVADQIPQILKTVLARTPSAIAELKRMADGPDSGRKDLDTKFIKAARDLTQNVTNLVLFMEQRGIPVQGVDLRELPQLKELSRTLVTWGNANSIFRADAKKDDIKREIAKFEKAVTDLTALMR
jgi:hypothetical protein